MLLKKTLQHLYSICWSNVKVETRISYTEEILTTADVTLESLAYLRQGYTLLYFQELKILGYFSCKRELQTVV